MGLRKDVWGNGLLLVFTYRIQKAYGGGWHYMQGGINILILLSHIQHNSLTGGWSHAASFHGWSTKFTHSQTLIQNMILFVTVQNKEYKREIKEKQYRISLLLAVIFGKDPHWLIFTIYSRLHVGRKMIVKFQCWRGYLLSMQ